MNAPSYDVLFAMFHESPAPMALHRLPGGHIVDVNRAWSEVYGYPREQVIGRTTSEIGLYNDPAIRERFYTILRQTGIVTRLEMAHRCGDGRQKTCLVSARPLDVGGESMFVVGAIDITEQKRFEEALRLSEERYALALQVTEDGHWDWNVQTDEIFDSPQSSRVLGVPPGQYRTRSEALSHARIHPEDRPRISAQWREALAGQGTEHQFEYRILRGEEPRWIHSRWKIFRDASGVALRVVGVVADITERKRAASELSASEARFRSLTELSSDWYWEQDEDLRFTYLSRQTDKLTGYTGDSSVGKLRWELAGMTPLSCTWQEHQAVLAARLPFRDLELRRVAPDGTVYYLSVSGTPIFDEEGRFKGYHGTGRSITERRRAEEQLRASEARFRSLTELSSDWYWEQDQDLRFTYLSEGVEDLAGYPAQSAIGKTRWESGDKTALSCSWTEHQAVLAARQPFRDFEYSRLDRDGVTRYVSISGAPIFDDEGHYRGYQGLGRNITERKRIEEELRASEARFRSLTELSSDWYWELDENLHFTYVSSAIYASFSGESSIGKTPWDRKGVTPLSGSWLEHRALLEARQPFRDFECARTGTDGSIIYTSVSGAPLFDRSGRFKGYHGTTRDITERRRIEEAQRASEERFSLAVAASTDGIWDWNIVTNEQYFSERAQAIFGLAPGPTVRQRSEWDALREYHPDDDPRREEALRRHIAGETPAYEGEWRVRQRGQGEYRWVYSRGVCVRDDSGRAVRMVGSFTDITERKRIEEELRSRQDMLDLAQKSARMAAFEWRAGPSPTGSPWARSWTVRVSAELEEMFGVAPGSFDGSFENWKKLIHPQDWPKVKHGIASATQTGEMSLEYRRVLSTSGETRWLESKGRVLCDAEGRPERVSGFVQDVTKRHAAEDELRRLEQQLRLAQRMEAMGTLAGGIAHDFNNILGAILGFGEMALRRAPARSRERRDLVGIMAAGERGRALVDRILAFSRSGVGELEPVHVERVAREALELLEAKLPKGIRIAKRLRAARAAIQGDPTQVHQVLMNLCTNAVQAMPSGGTLRVALDTVRVAAPRPVTVGNLSAGDYVVLAVTDTGTGIGRDIIERIFDPFFTTKAVGTGTGLGLSLVHGIVTELGGAIDVESTPGQGSTFTVHLPRSDDAPESHADDEGALPRGNGERVLVVDDEKPLVRVATQTLKELGYAPRGFTSSEAALAAFRADPGRFDALITDERMPEMYGTTLIREVRDIRREIPVLLMSGYVSGAIARRARDAGADDVLKKPLLARDLAVTLARVLRR